MADLVDEVKQISRQLQCTFNHVLQEPNDLADGLAKEGASFQLLVDVFFLALVCFLVSEVFGFSDLAFLLYALFFFG